jgi:hypothetical protein
MRESAVNKRESLSVAFPDVRLILGGLPPFPGHIAGLAKDDDDHSVHTLNE